jgi:hypothetical protein
MVAVARTPRWCLGRFVYTEASKRIKYKTSQKSRVLSFLEVQMTIHIKPKSRFLAARYPGSTFWRHESESQHRATRQLWIGWFIMTLVFACTGLVTIRPDHRFSKIPHTSEVNSAEVSNILPPYNAHVAALNAKLIQVATEASRSQQALFAALLVEERVTKELSIQKETLARLVAKNIDKEELLKQEQTTIETSVKHAAVKKVAVQERSIAQEHSALIVAAAEGDTRGCGHIIGDWDGISCWCRRDHAEGGARRGLCSCDKEDMYSDGACREGVFVLSRLKQST